MQIVKYFSCRYKQVLLYHGMLLITQLLISELIKQVSWINVGTSGVLF
jgi:hypothetical protein